MADPQVNPNALAAPAEGFGQTVSFSFDPRGEVPQLKPLQSRGPTVAAVGVSDGHKSSAPQFQDQAPDPTAALLMKAGAAIMEKELDEARSKEFVRGMQQAMGGQAVQEIKESVPWYARLFGEAPVVEGARAYTAQDQVNKVLTKQVADIDQIQTLGPQAAADHFNQVVKGSLTGDAPTDLVVMKALSEQMPALMKAQAKSHYAWNQKQASKTMAESYRSGAAGLQQYGQLLADDRMSQADFEVAAQRTVASMLPPAGINEEHMAKTLTNSMMEMAQGGQFHALNALTKSGVLAALSPEQAKRVESTIEAAATKSRDRYAFKFSREIGEIKSDAAKPPVGMTPKALSERIDKINETYQKTTGSPVGIFSSDQKADMLSNTFNAFKSEADKAATRAEALSDRNAKAHVKEAAAAEQAATVDRYVASGDIDMLKVLPGVTEDTIHRAVFEKAKENPSAAPQYLLQAYAKSRYINPLIANDMQQDMNMARSAQVPTDGFFKSVAAFRAATELSPDFANAYFGDHAKRLTLASKMLGGNIVDNPNAGPIFSMVMNDALPKVNLDKKQNEAVTKALISKGSTLLPTWLNGSRLRDDSVRAMSTDVHAEVEAWMGTGLSQDEATARAISEQLGPGTKGARGEILGGYYIKRTPGSSDDRLDTLMQGEGKSFTAVPEEMRSEVFESFLHDKVKVPANAGTVQILRMPDAGGTARFVVNATDKDGGNVIRTFDALALQTHAKEMVKWKRKGAIGGRQPDEEEIAAFNAQEEARRAVKGVVGLPTFGPAITFRPAENARDIYTGAAIDAQGQIKATKPLTN